MRLFGSIYFNWKNLIEMQNKNRTAENKFPDRYEKFTPEQVKELEAFVCDGVTFSYWEEKLFSMVSEVHINRTMFNGTCVPSKNDIKYYRVFYMLALPGWNDDMLGQQV